MMDFIMVPALFGVVTLGIYKLFELFVRRRERIMLIEKLNPEQLSGYSGQKPLKFIHQTTNAISIGCLLVGMGLGLLVGIQLFRIAPWDFKELVIGGSILFFGGCGLIASVFINRWLEKRE